MLRFTIRDVHYFFFISSNDWIRCRSIIIFICVYFIYDDDDENLSVIEWANNNIDNNIEWHTIYQSDSMCYSRFGQVLQLIEFAFIIDLFVMGIRQIFE